MEKQKETEKPFHTQIADMKKHNESLTAMHREKKNLNSVYIH